MYRRVDVDVLVDGAARVRAFTNRSALRESGRPGSNRDVQLGKLSGPLRGKGFSAAVAETG